MKKSFMTIVLMFTLSSVFAAEVETDCSAMNENREKVFKPTKEVTKVETGSVQQ